MRGGDKPDLEAGVAAIRKVWKTLPARPGVYRMHDVRGDVLYVGKARALKSRVTNYTQVARLPKRLQRMVSQTRSMTIVTTRTEAEALLLEAQLIKRFRPAYNVLLRDDKSFPFILLREDHAFPRVQKHRGARRAKGQYFGPFASAGSVTRTLNALQKLFLLRSCSDSFFETARGLACSTRSAAARRLASGGSARRNMPSWSRTPRLSSPASRPGCRSGSAADGQGRRSPGLRACRRLSRPAARAHLHPGQPDGPRRGAGDADVFALACKGGAMSIQAFFIRGGQNWGHRAFFPAHTNDVPEADVMSSFLVQFYEEVPPPRRVLVDRDLPDRELARGSARRAGRAQGCLRAPAARFAGAADRPGQAQRRGSARPADGGDRDPDQGASRARRDVRAGRRAQAHRGL